MAIENSRIPAFVLGSSITAVGVIRSLGRAGVSSYSICGANEHLVSASRWYRPAPNTAHVVPGPEELPAYLATLQVPKAVLIPCSDDWVRAVAELPEALKKRF